jgi:D-Tyr-tRNAtyr deacylase
MKLLMIFSKNFEYQPTIKTIEDAEDREDGFTLNDVLVAFIHAEEEDEENEAKVITKLVKNLKWASKKNGVMNVVLHSFAHLSDSKASPDFTKKLFDQVEAKMKNASYQVHQTPFGYFLDLNINAPGYSMARVFKSF